MFVTGGIVRFILGASAQRFGDGERFIFSVREFKAFTGLQQGIALKDITIFNDYTCYIACCFSVLFSAKN